MTDSRGRVSFAVALQKVLAAVALLRLAWHILSMAANICFTKGTLARPLVYKLYWQRKGKVVVVY